MCRSDPRHHTAVIPSTSPSITDSIHYSRQLCFSICSTFTHPAFLYFPTSISSISLLSLLLLLLIMRASNAPYGRSPTPVKAHRETLADDVSGAVFANDKGVCVPAPLLLQCLETLTQIDTQLGPTITIPVCPPSLILSIHASLLLPPTSAFISQLQSVSLSSSQVSSPPLTPVLFPQLPWIVTSPTTNLPPRCPSIPSVSCHSLLLHLSLTYPQGQIFAYGWSGPDWEML